MFSVATLAILECHLQWFTDCCFQTTALNHLLFYCILHTEGQVKLQLVILVAATFLPQALLLCFCTRLRLYDSPPALQSVGNVCPFTEPYWFEASECSIGYTVQ